MQVCNVDDMMRDNARTPRPFHSVLHAFLLLRSQCARTWFTSSLAATRGRVALAEADAGAKMCEYLLAS